MILLLCGPKDGAGGSSHGLESSTVDRRLSSKLGVENMDSRKTLLLVLLSGQSPKALDDNANSLGNLAAMQTSGSVPDGPRASHAPCLILFAYPFF